MQFPNHALFFGDAIQAFSIICSSGQSAGRSPDHGCRERTWLVKFPEFSGWDAVAQEKNLREGSVCLLDLLRMIWRSCFREGSSNKQAFRADDLVDQLASLYANSGALTRKIVTQLNQHIEE